MNPIQSAKQQFNVHLLPKPTQPQLSLRHLEPQAGILWNYVEETFLRFNWDILESTDLFLKAHHPQAGYTIQVSRMGRETVMINQNYIMLPIDDLAELEIIADVEVAPPTHTISQPTQSFIIPRVVRRWFNM